MEENRYNWILETVTGLSRQFAEVLREDGCCYVNQFLGNQFLRNQSFGEERDCGYQEKSMENTAEHVLKTVFGYNSFRPMQREIIQNVLDGRDTLAVLPTGGGKSLCYQIPALLLKGLTVVVSPLIALMQDQVSQLETLGVPAVFLNSSLDWGSYRETCDRIRSGEIKLLYVSPEGLNTNRIQDLLHSEGLSVDCITIDEAHCISQWGHDFRPDYLEIASVREQFPKAVCLALTATATNQVRNDIVSHLKMDNPEILVASFNRPNLFLEVKRRSNGMRQVLDFLRGHRGECGIVYCFSRKQVDDLTDFLVENGISAINYHAGLSDDERSRHQRDFIQDKVDVMVATVAFGMGINKPDVRFVIHLDLPKSIEQYYQEIGRAGRDGLPASALLLFSGSDIHKIRYFFNEKDDPTNDERLLHAMIQYAEGRTCRRHFLLSYFGEHYNPLSEDAASPDTCCDICARGEINSSDATIPAQKYMSCVVRTKQRYGASYVIDVLMGSKNKRIVSNGDDKITTWGIGRELSKQDWFELNSCLLDAGYISKSEEHSVITLTEYGKHALMERWPIRLPMEFQAKKNAYERPTSGEKKKPVFLISEGDEEGIRIVEELRDWRRNLADEMNVPPYVIFGDKTMFDIAVKKPNSMKELMDCYGIGENKAEKFGEKILRIVRDE